VTLDALTVALKAAGFQRPPGSPRLVTRLRRMKDIEVLPNGRVRLTAIADGTTTPTAAEPLAEPALPVEDADEANGDGEHAADVNGTAAETGAKRRRSRRGGRRRGGRGRKAGAATPAPPAE
jgi:hypothetical protein